jgi:plastocyanin
MRTINILASLVLLAAVVCGEDMMPKELALAQSRFNKDIENTAQRYIKEIDRSLQNAEKKKDQKLVEYLKGLKNEISQKYITTEASIDDSTMLFVMAGKNVDVFLNNTKIGSAGQFMPLSPISIKIKQGDKVYFVTSLNEGENHTLGVSWVYYDKVNNICMGSNFENTKGFPGMYDNNTVFTKCKQGEAWTNVANKMKNNISGTANPEGLEVVPNAKEIKFKQLVTASYCWTVNFENAKKVK